MSRMNGRRLVPSPSMVVAFVALGLAIGGVSYAAVRLPANAVKRTNLQNNAVNGSKVANDSLTGDDVKESTLDGINAAGLDRVSYKTANSVSPPAASVDAPGVGSASAVCDPGSRAIGGGAKLESPDNGEMADSYADSGGSVWTVHVANGDTTAAHGFTVFAICLPVGSIG